MSVFLRTAAMIPNNYYDIVSRNAMTHFLKEKRKAKTINHRWFSINNPRVANGWWKQNKNPSSSASSRPFIIIIIYTVAVTTDADFGSREKGFRGKYEYLRCLNADSDGARVIISSTGPVFRLDGSCETL